MKEIISNFKYNFPKYQNTSNKLKSLHNLYLIINYIFFSTEHGNTKSLEEETA